MKTISLFCLFVLFAIPLSFPQIGFGIRAGVNSNRIKPAEFTGTEYKITVPKDATMGFHFGLMGQLQLFNFYLQPELLFSSNRNDIIITNVLTREEELSEHKFNKLNIPVILGYKYKSLKLGIGPVGSILLRSKSDLLKERGFEQQINGMTYGYQADIGLDIGKLALDFKYEGNLSKFGEGIKINNQTYKFDQRINQLLISVGLLF